MKIHGLSVVKNESDIIVQNLLAAVQWCDFIYVMDNGSDDGTWEAVRDLAGEHKAIIPYEQNSCVFQPSLRGVLFNHYRGYASPGDWWCRLDADEFYIDNPRTFLAAVSDRYNVVWSASLSYYFTDKDLERYRQKPALYADDVPIEKKCRYYINNWSEPRFLRHRNELVWGDNETWPSNRGESYPRRIRVKHYQWRSPQQIQKRMNVRRQAIESGCVSFRHERAANWQARITDKSSPRILLNPDEMNPSWEQRIVDAATLDYDDLMDEYVIREDLMPPVKGRRATRREKIVERLKSWMRGGAADKPSHGR